MERLIVAVTGDDAPWPELESFPWLEALGPALPQITVELAPLLENIDDIPIFGVLSPEQYRLSSGGVPWRTHIFLFFNRRVERNISGCPETMKALDAVPGLMLAMFSVLPPGAEIVEHRGPFKGVLRLHLPLVVPDDYLSCGIEVAGTVHHWKVGEPVVFDDTFPHHAWNHSTSPRVVLIADFHRELPFGVRHVSRTMVWLLGRSSFGRTPIDALEAGSLASPTA